MEAELWGHFSGANMSKFIGTTKAPLITTPLTPPPKNKYLPLDVYEDYEKYFDANIVEELDIVYLLKHIRQNLRLNVPDSVFKDFDDKQGEPRYSLPPPDHPVKHNVTSRIRFQLYVYRLLRICHAEVRSLEKDDEQLLTQKLKISEKLRHQLEYLRNLSPLEVQKQFDLVHLDQLRLAASEVIRDTNFQENRTTKLRQKVLVNEPHMTVRDLRSMLQFRRPAWNSNPKLTRLPKRHMPQIDKSRETWLIPMELENASPPKKEPSLPPDRIPIRMKKRPPLKRYKKPDRPVINQKNFFKSRRRKNELFKSKYL